MWDQLYGTQQLLMAGGVTAGDTVLYKEYDLKTHRKIRNIDESLYLVFAPTGNATVTDFSFTQSTLLRLP